jgi:MtN3 and saliva related transmembrane protein
MQINNFFPADFFGAIAGVLTTVRLFPQLYKSWKSKDTRSLSFLFLFILFFQALFLILYGLAKPDNLIIYMNIAPLLCSLILIFLKLEYK